MVIAAETAFLDEAVGKIGAAVTALTVDQAKGAAEILVEHQVFAHG